MKRVVILGSTGSIGRQTLDVIDRLSDISVIALTANSNVDLMEKQVRKYQPRIAVMADHEAASELERRTIDTTTEILVGEDGLVSAASLSDADMVVSAVVGFCGLVPTIAAIKAGKDIALANKETLVAAGSLVTDLVRQHGVRLLPVDSEHSAIFQCLATSPDSQISRLLLTASGGPFRNTPATELAKVTVGQALDHPTWRMGGKITIDSATLMNKGLEVIEARWLFEVPADRIEVVIHPESIIHSMVEFVDTSVIAQLGTPDMRVPIQLALTYPERKVSPANCLNLFEVGQLNFMKPDLDRFPSLRLAYEALEDGGSSPCVLNAANEVAVNLFMQERIPFLHIPKTVGKVLELQNRIDKPSLEDVLASDAWARDVATEVALSL